MPPTMERCLLERMDSQRYASPFSKPLEETRIVEKRLLALQWFSALKASLEAPFRTMFSRFLWSLGDCTWAHIGMSQQGEKTSGDLKCVECR